MSVEVIGIDHLYLAVSDLQRSEKYWDRIMPLLGFRKNSFQNERGPLPLSARQERGEGRFVQRRRAGGRRCQWQCHAPEWTLIGRDPAPEPFLFTVAGLVREHALLRAGGTF